MMNFPQYNGEKMVKINNNGNIVNALWLWSFCYFIGFCWTFAICLPCFVGSHSSFTPDNFDFWLIHKTSVPSAIFFPSIPVPFSFFDAKLQSIFPSVRWSPLSSSASAGIPPSALPLHPASSSSERRYSLSRRSCALRIWRFRASIRIIFASRAAIAFLLAFACLRWCCRWKGMALV